MMDNKEEKDEYWTNKEESAPGCHIEVPPEQRAVD